MRFLIVGVLLFLAGFFTSAEFSLIRLRPTHVQVLETDGIPGAKSIQRLQKRLRRAIVASQFGTTLALISVGWTGHSISVYWIVDYGLTSRETLINIVLFSFLVLFSVLLGGLLPKAWVLYRPEASALKLAPILESVIHTLSPLFSSLERIVSLILHIVGLPTKSEALVPVLSAGELESLIESGNVTGLMPDERNIIEGVFSLRDTQVREVMVPRSGMVTLPIEVTFAEMMEAVHDTNHARFPVIGQSLDDVRGILDLRRLAEPIAHNQLHSDTRLAPYVTPVLRIQESSSLADLMSVIRTGQPILIVVDEHGGTEGLVTVADLTSEIVGEDDENGSSDPDLQLLSVGHWLVAGDLEIFELNRQLGIQLPEAEGHHTLAGFLLEQLQHIPSPGESIRFNGNKFEITCMDGPRIERVQITFPLIDSNKDSNNSLES
ncbi:hypothetical protein PMYN1_Chma451 (chromatophore) [Paulinella micropora]|uniref:HlyC/CorC family transporter n=1 Tax=Paulinella micropora TaxID=1928728 RepID=A0A1L5YC45_9EUKA|nr:hypothetical protein PCKR_498 [Paulinella micropora]AQX45047.1 hypothetical protein PFK_498 [Paulinella micropora]BBL86260.1 hypothetical protein PMYN1_Chma451 [Paulinella micropora]